MKNIGGNVVGHTPLHRVLEEEIAGTPISKIIAYMMSSDFLDTSESIKESDRVLSIPLSRYERACVSVANEFMQEHAKLEAQKSNALNKKKMRLLKAKAWTAMSLMTNSVEEFHDLSKVVRLGVRAGFTLVDMGKLICPECAKCRVIGCPGAKSEDNCGHLP